MYIIVMMKTYIVLDLEATCYDKTNKMEQKPSGFVNEIIEIGAYKLTQQGDVIDSFEKFIQEKVSL